MYDISFDERTGLLTMVLTGFWTGNLLKRFADELGEVASEAARRRPDFPVLTDARDFPVQSAEITAGLARIIQEGGMRNPGRRAAVVGSVLGKLQAERVMTEPHLRVFTEIGEARAWLTEGTSVDTAAP